MSYTELNKGKLIPTKKTIGQIVEELGGKDVKPEDALEWVYENCYNKYLFRNGVVYEIEMELDGKEDLYLSDVSVAEDGSISFLTIHYNGGGSWQEVVEAELKKKGL